MTVMHSILCLFLLFLFINSIDIAAATNITIGTILTAGEATSSWSSPSGDFAFGFFPVNLSVFVLAIWFNATKPPAVVWTPNYTLPGLQSGSTLQLTNDGQLSVKDHTDTQVWNPGIVQASAVALLDSGNLVMVGNDAKDFLWESFNYFIDTLLPGQTMPLGTVLQARIAVSDFSEGRFRLAVQTDGDVVLYPMALLGGTLYDAYWSTGTVGFGDSLVYNNSGSFYLTMSNGTQHNLFSSQIYSLEDYYQRATLDFDGVFRMYVYPRSKTSNMQQTWTIVDQIPEDICSVVTENIGSGACGFNSYCTLDEQRFVECKCPDHYSLIDPTAKYKGCAPEFDAQNCHDKGTSKDQYEFVSSKGLNWPFHDYEHYTDVNEEQCRDNCLSDCFCAVAIFSTTGCWKKKLPLSLGRTQEDSLALIKVRRSNASSPSTDNNQSIVNKERSTWVTALATSSGILNVITIAFICFLLLCHKKKIKMLKRNTQEDTMSELNIRSFTYKELQSATNDFSEELGRGSFGIVYKGLLPFSKSKKIAVKKLDRMLQNNTEEEFLNEARAIGQTHHKNLVKLIGLCNEGTHRLLVYEYMSNASLKHLLFCTIRPKWNKRVEIALGIARGLLYLHEECSTGIIHCDIKPHNILLDDNFVAKISDFGLAKLLKTDQTRTNISIRGTRGYVAPEWFKGKIITKKVDVYSFGIMLLEIISCRKSLGDPTDEHEQVVLADWVYDCYKDGKLEAIVENEEDAMADFWRLERFVMVAIWCIQEDPLRRPSMYKVVQMLEGTIAVSLPPDPLFAI